MRLDRLFALALGAVALGVAGLALLQPLAFLAGPAALIFLLLPRRDADPGERLAYAVGGAVALWVVLPWFLRLTGAGLGPVSIVVGIGSGLAFLVLLRHRILAGGLQAPRPAEGAVTAVLAATALLRFAPAWSWFSAPGADMSMHTYVAALFRLHDGIPASFAPLVPLGGLAAYAPGFHGLMALASGTGAASLLEAGLYTACLAYALFGLGLYAFLRRFAGPVPSLAGVLLAAFGAPHPQDMFVSGTNPSVLGMALAFLAAAWLVRAGRRLGPGALLLGGLLVAAVPLTHAIPALVLAYAAVAAGGGALALRPELRAVLARNGVLLAGIASGLLLPAALAWQNLLSDAERRWSLAWQEQLLPGVGRLPAFLWHYGGAALAVCAASAVFLAAVRDRRARLPLALAALVALLLLNSRVGVLPLSAGLYPDRTAQILVGLAAVFWALFVQRLQERRGPALPWFAAAAAALPAAFALPAHYFAGSREQAVAPADLQAFDWVARNLPADGLILNNYGDAGLWLPAFCLRPVVVLHTVPFFLDEIRARQLEARPRFIYLGAGSPARFSPALTRADFDGRPEEFPVLYDAGGATVYGVTDPDALHAWLLEQPFVRRFLERYDVMTLPR